MQLENLKRASEIAANISEINTRMKNAEKLRTELSGPKAEAIQFNINVTSDRSIRINIDSWDKIYQDPCGTILEIISIVERKLKETRISLHEEALGL